ncbi:MAG: hydrogenase expression/formation protein HypE [Candidatus Omnitrophica bacterium]|nr:hydrogenase expression/formation protein HypE [Candidatus Omnitrophota bacterium]
MGKILLAHGSGGKLTHELIKEVFHKRFSNPVLAEYTDSAILDYKEPLAFTTDSFVVNPLFFPGGDIGTLAVCGTINDLTMVGAEAQYLALSMIIEEGTDISLIERIATSIASVARINKVRVVTGDTKVVEKGACDKVFINTSGVGVLVAKKKPSVKNIRCGDKILLTGCLANHGLAVLSARQGLGLKGEIKSDCAALQGLLLPLLKKTDAVRFLRDPTRGGAATTLNEVAESTGLALNIREDALPIASKVRAATELFGIDPLYIANEGIALLIVAQESEPEALRFLRQHPLGRRACSIGTVSKEPKSKVILETSLGTKRIVEMLSHDMLPRIC